MNDIEKRFNGIREAEPDAEDLRAIDRVKKVNDTSEGVSLEAIDAMRAEQDFSGKISLRVPKTLHRDLAQGAKDEGISLNQYILYKLAR